MTFKLMNKKNFLYYYPVGLFFILLFIYFKWFGSYILFFQENNFLFIFSNKYLEYFIVKPGGLLEFSGNFFTQFYLYPSFGSMIIALTISSSGLIFLKISHLLQVDKTVTPIISIIPISFLTIMQTYYYHMMVYNLGFIMVLIYFLLSISLFTQTYNFSIFISLPIFYYFAGAWVWIFSGMFVLYNILFIKGKTGIVNSIFTVITASLSFIIFKNLLFLQPPHDLIFFPLPLEAPLSNILKYKIFFYSTAGYFIFFPLIIKVLHSLKFTNKKIAVILNYASAILFILTVFLLYKFYNKQTARTINLQKYVVEQRWHEAIQYHENYPSKNLIGQYFYNISLSETDQLCDRLFFGNQSFGTQALILPWDDNLTHISRGAYFFYSIGLINEAHRWAYTEMSVYGYRPENVKMLIKCYLINKQYRLAEKYINLLKKTLNYKTWAKEYEKLLFKTDLINNHHELGKKIKLLAGENFFIHTQNPENNISFILNTNPKNKKAFEYLIAWLLFNKNIEGIADRMFMLKEMGYTYIPRHIEEAALVYADIKKELPDRGGLKIRPETENNFVEYVSTYKNISKNRTSGINTMQSKFGNTFWYYFHFK